MKIEITLAVSQEKVPLRHQKYHSGIAISKKTRRISITSSVNYYGVCHSQSRDIRSPLFLYVSPIMCSKNAKNLSQSRVLPSKKLYFTH